MTRPPKEWPIKLILDRQSTEWCRVSFGALWLEWVALFFNVRYSVMKVFISTAKLRP